MPVSPRIRSARPSAAAALVAIALCVAAVPTVAGAETIARAGAAERRPLPGLATSGMRDGLSRALATGRLTEAQYTLERAASLFDRRDVARRFGEVARPDPHLATLILRDVAGRLDDLAGADRRRAIGLLSRPDDDEQAAYEDSDPEYGSKTETVTCDVDLCVHYVDEVDAPAFDHAASEAFADQVLATMQTVWATETATYGYREPPADTQVLPSTSNGGDARFDVYLANLGAGLFGYCTTNDAELADFDGTYDISTYCVLDNDYVDYGYADPLDPLQVTAAHEFFHAVQGAYDFFEDAYFMEGTATWMEDEVFDDVNDLHNYLGASPLSNPTVPLDKATGLRVYGTWIWWRFLSESLGAPVIRRIWLRADGSSIGPDKYSTQAVALELASRDVPFGRTFADFAARNVRPATFYEEGGAYGTVTTQASRTISGTNRSFSSAATVDHMASHYVAVTRGAGVRADATLRVTIDGPARQTFPQARVVLVTSGGATVVRFRLDDEGRGSKRVAFGADVTEAYVIVSNASTRFTRCWAGNGTWSCWGTPVDENLRFTIAASLVR
jgi:hypothetical protein